MEVVRIRYIKGWIEQLPKGNITFSFRLDWQGGGVHPQGRGLLLR